VTSFDISSRDVPKKRNETPNHVASITRDGWSGEAMLSLTPKANADDANAVGKISLASLAPPSAQTCAGPQGWAAWYEARLFSNGAYVYVVVPRASRST
jgi:hypothetical protein